VTATCMLTAVAEIEFGPGLRGHVFEPEVNPDGAVVILHERYGLVQHTLDLAQKLADDGYLALAPDLFSRWQGDHEALRRGDIRVTLPDDEVRAIVEAGLDFLKQRTAKVALMGVCQSGRYPIVVGSRRPDVNALVVFYGAAQASDWRLTPDQPRPMADMIAATSAPGLYVFGEADHVISLDDVLRLKGTLEVQRKSYLMHIFPHVPHGWLNNTMPGRYRPHEADVAWLLLQGFLDDVFAGRWPQPGRVMWHFHSDVGQDYDFSRNVRLE